MNVPPADNALLLVDLSAVDFMVGSVLFGRAASLEAFFCVDGTLFSPSLIARGDDGSPSLIARGDDVLSPSLIVAFS